MSKGFLRSSSWAPLFLEGFHIFFAQLPKMGRNITMDAAASAWDAAGMLKYFEFCKCDRQERAAKILKGAPNFF